MTKVNFERFKIWRTKRRSILAAMSATHFLHDGFTDLLFFLLPIWQAEFGLTLTQAGFLKTMRTGVSALLQMPMGILSERLGERLVLAVGTAVAAIAYLSFGLVNSFVGLVLVAMLLGVGVATQHPLASALVARAYTGGAHTNDERRVALGLYNFSGDLGKMVIPGLAGLIAGSVGWHAVTTGYAGIGLVAALGIFVALLAMDGGNKPKLKKSFDRHEPLGNWGIRQPGGFAALAVVGVIDSVVRTGFLTFFPFLIRARGASLEELGLSLGLIFAGGAAGKFACGFLAARQGVIPTIIITELITGVGIIALVALRADLAFLLLPVVGFGLNGTSSVLYGSVAEFVAPERHARGFGLFYSLVTVGSAVSPLLFGVVSDRFNIEVTVVALGLVALLTIPLVVRLRTVLDERNSAY